MRSRTTTVEEEERLLGRGSDGESERVIGHRLATSLFKGPVVGSLFCFRRVIVRAPNLDLGFGKHNVSHTPRYFPLGPRQPQSKPGYP